MPSVQDLRRELTDLQRAVINSVWEDYCSRRQWIPRLVLHQKLGTNAVRSNVVTLGGSIIFKSQDGQDERYRLTFLGVLLTDYAEKAEDLLIRYLAYARARFSASPEELTVKGEELERALQLNEGQSQRLLALIELSNMGNWGGSRQEWTVTLPRDVDELPSDDLLAYVHGRAMRDYRPDMPVEAHLRHMAFASGAKSRTPGEVHFIGNAALRALVEADWQEAQQVLEAGAWKSCLILCGSVLEGMLLDVLRQDEETARRAYGSIKRSAAPDLDRWFLNDLVEVASHIGLLESGAVHLGHALREFRNLVHPGRQVRESTTVTQEEAEVAINVVKICMRSLVRHRRTE